MAPGLTPGAAALQEACRPYVDACYHLDTTDRVPWHFAEARNASMDLAAEDYVLILDDDEALPQPDQLAELPRLIAPDVSAVRVEVVNFLPAGQAPDVCRQERVFRNVPALRYRGAVHHGMPLKPYQEATRTRTTEASLRVHHFGYDLALEERRRKYLPRLALYRRELEACRGDDVRTAYYRYKLGECFYVCGEAARAVEPLLLSLPWLKNNGRRRCLLLIAKITGGTMERFHGTAGERRQLLALAHMLREYDDPEALRHAAGLYHIAGKRALSRRLMRSTTTA